MWEKTTVDVSHSSSSIDCGKIFDYYSFFFLAVEKFFSAMLFFFSFLVVQSVTSLESLASTAGGRQQVFVKTCMYHGSIVAVKKIEKGVTLKKVESNRRLLLELKKVGEVGYLRCTTCINRHLVDSSAEFFKDSRWKPSVSPPCQVFTIDEGGE